MTKTAKRFTFTIAHGVCLWRANGVWYHNPRYWTALDGTRMVSAPRIDEISVPKIFRPINWHNGDYQVRNGERVIGVVIIGDAGAPPKSNIDAKFLSIFHLTKKYI